MRGIGLSPAHNHVRSLSVQPPLVNMHVSTAVTTWQINWHIAYYLQQVVNYIEGCLRVSYRKRSLLTFTFQWSSSGSHNTLQYITCVFCFSI